MKQRLRLLVLALIIAFLLSSCAAPLYKAAVEPLPVGRPEVVVALTSAGGHLYAPVRIDGHDAGLFVVDTGSNANVVDEAVARRLALPEVAHVDVDAGRLVARAPRRVQSLAVGDLVLKEHYVASIDASAIVGDYDGYGSAGILGAPALQAMPFTLDYVSRRITFYRRDAFRPPAGAVAAPVRFRDGLPCVKCRINGGLEVWMLLDTGAYGPLNLNRAYWEKHAELAPGDVRRSDVAGTVEGPTARWRTRIDSVELFGRRFRSVPASLSKDRKDDDLADEEVAGTVGGGLLCNFRLTVDYARKRLWAEWAPEPPVAELVSRGVNLSEQDFLGFTRLELAIDRGQTNRALALIAAGADVNASPPPRQSLLAGALAVDDAEAARALLAAGAAVRPDEGGHLLVGALFEGYSDIARALIAYGADVKYRTSSGQTTLIADALGRAGLAGLLAGHGADVNAADKEGRTALLYAAYMGDTAAVRELLSAGARVNAVDAEVYTPLMVAGYGNIETARLLIAAGADVNAAQKEGGTALMVAALQGKADIVRALLDAGADPNAASADGHVALMNAAAGGHTEAARALIAAGADVNARDANGRRPLDYARKHGDMVRMLKEHGAR